MNQSFPKTFLVDVGQSWTKAFLVEISENKLNIVKKQAIPTSSGDLSFSLNYLAKELKIDKTIGTILTGSGPDVEKLAKDLSITYVPAEEAAKSFSAYLEKSNFKKSILLDSEDYVYSSSTKASQIGAFLSSELTEVDIENYFGNRSLHPRSVPVQPEALELEEAFLRLSFAGNRDFINAKNVVNLVVSSHLVSLEKRQSKLALLLADTMFAGRVAQVKVDNELFARSFGAYLHENKEVENVEVSFLEDVGAFLSLGGKAKLLLDYGFPEKQEVSIVEDEVALIPAGVGQTVKVALQDSSEKEKYILQGGVFGLLLDGRVKPLKLGFGRAESRNLIKKWSSELEKTEVLA